MSNSSTSTSERPLHGLHILLAEDCIDQGRLYLNFLTQSGANVTLECNGQSAVDAVDKSPAHFDALVMDFQMPEMDGLKATQEVRKLGFHGAIIAITAYDNHKLREEWYLAGCNAYLEKPVQQQILVETIQQHLAHAEKNTPSLSVS